MNNNLGFTPKRVRNIINIRDFRFFLIRQKKTKNLFFSANKIIQIDRLTLKLKENFSFGQIDPWNTSLCVWSSSSSSFVLNGRHTIHTKFNLKQKGSNLFLNVASLMTTCVSECVFVDSNLRKCVNQIIIGPPEWNFFFLLYIHNSYLIFFFSLPKHSGKNCKKKETGYTQQTMGEQI